MDAHLMRTLQSYSRGSLCNRPAAVSLECSLVIHLQISLSNVCRLNSAVTRYVLLLLFLLTYFFSSTPFSYRSLGGASRHFESGCNFTMLIDMGPYPHSAKIWGQNVHFYVFLRFCSHKRQCFTDVVRNIENIKQYRQGTMTTLFCEK